MIKALGIGAALSVILLAGCTTTEYVAGYPPVTVATVTTYPVATTKTTYYYPYSTYYYSPVTTYYPSGISVTPARVTYYPGSTVVVY